MTCFLEPLATHSPNCSLSSKTSGILSAFELQLTLRLSGSIRQVESDQQSAMSTTDPDLDKLNFDDWLIDTDATNADARFTAPFASAAHTRQDELNLDDWLVNPDATGTYAKPTAPSASAAHTRQAGPEEGGSDEWDISHHVKTPLISTALDYVARREWHEGVVAFDPDRWRAWRFPKETHHPLTALETVRMHSDLARCLRSVLQDTTKSGLGDKSRIVRSIFTQGERFMGDKRNSIKQQETRSSAATIASRLASSAIVHTASSALSAHIRERLRDALLLELGEGPDHSDGALFACPTGTWSAGEPVEQYRLVRLRSADDLDEHNGEPVSTMTIRDLLDRATAADERPQPVQRKSDSKKRRSGDSETEPSRRQRTNGGSQSQ